MKRGGEKLRGRTWPTKEEAVAELAKVVENPSFVPAPMTKKPPGSGHISTVLGGYRWETQINRVKRYGRVYAEKKDAEEELAKVLAADDFVPAPCRWSGKRKLSNVVSLRAAADEKAKAKEKKDAREALIKSGMQLARQIAMKQIRKHTIYIALSDDIHSAALEGLIKAADAFKPSQGTRFLGYAGFRIRGEILDFIRSRDHVSRHYRMKAKNDNAVVLPAAPLSLERLVEERGYGSLPTTDPTKDFEFWEISELVDVSCRKLPERLQQILRLYYFEEVNLADIGKLMGFTESRACQLLKVAHGKLHKILNDPAPLRAAS